MNIRELLELIEDSSKDIEEKVKSLDFGTHYRLTDKELREFLSVESLPRATIIKLDSTSDNGNDYRVYSYISSISPHDDDYLNRFTGLFYKVMHYLRKRQVLGYPNTSTLTPTHDVRVASVLL